MAETKAYHHGDTVTGGANPPPYSTGPPPGAHPYPSGPQAPISQPTTAPAVFTVAMPQPMGPQSTRTTCRFCKCEISTRVESNATTKTHLMALGLFIIGCWLCCCIPYCVDSCMNTNHYCPSCNAFLGSYES